MSFGRFAIYLTFVGLVVSGLDVVATAQSPGLFDGVYKGSRKVVVDSSGPQCHLANRPDSVTIKNSHFEVRFGPGTIDANVASDGSFSGSTWRPARHGLVTISLKGRIMGGRLEADIGEASCLAHLSLSKV